MTAELIETRRAVRTEPLLGRSQAPGSGKIRSTISVDLVSVATGAHRWCEEVTVEDPSIAWRKSDVRLRSGRDAETGGQGRRRFDPIR